MSEKGTDEEEVRVFSVYIGTQAEDGPVPDIYFEDEAVSEAGSPPFAAEAKADVEFAEGDATAVFDAMILLDGPSAGAVSEVFRAFFRAGYLLGQKRPDLKIHTPSEE